MSEMKQNDFNTGLEVPGNLPEDSQRGENHKAKKGHTSGKASTAALLACCILLSGAAGFGGGIAASRFAVSGDGEENPTSVSASQSTGASYTQLSTGSTGMTVAQVAAQTANSVVEITTESVTTGNWLQQYVTSGAGSGVILSEDGYIVTNNHVIEDATKITVRLHNGESYQATLVGTDSRTDIALIKIEASGLTPVVLGDSDTLVVGEDAIAVGNPLGSLGGTVTNGIISALDREITLDGETMNLLQTNAAINPGNSGGGLFNGKGELIGLVVAKSSGSGIEGLGFAIPVNEVKEIVSQLMENGYVTGRPLLGVSLIDITTLQDVLRYQVHQAGVYIYQVTGEAAAQAGLKAGDCITAVNGAEVSSSDDVKEAVSGSSVGDEMTLSIIRGTEKMDVTVIIGEEKPSSFQMSQSGTESL